MEMSVRCRGRNPPKPLLASPTASASATSTAVGGADQGREGGWQLHHSSNGLPFYYNIATGESVWARESGGAAREPREKTGDRRENAELGEAPAHFDLRDSQAPPSGEEGESSFSSGTDSTTASSSRHSSASGYSSSDDERDSASTQGSSQSSDTTSGSSTDSSRARSVEAKFRYFARSREGRDMLAEEVHGLVARQAKHGTRQENFSQGWRRHGKHSPRTSETDSEEYSEDVEAPFKRPDTDSDRSSSSASSFSLHLSSSGASDLSLLAEDPLLERLERVEKNLALARVAMSTLFRTSCGVARCASWFVWRQVSHGAARVRRRLLTVDAPATPTSAHENTV